MRTILVLLFAWMNTGLFYYFTHEKSDDISDPTINVALNMVTMLTMAIVPLVIGAVVALIVRKSRPAVRYSSIVYGIAIPSCYLAYGGSRLLPEREIGSAVLATAFCLLIYYTIYRMSTWSGEAANVSDKF